MKDKIIEAARRRFFQFGLRKVTMDEIASDLAISKKTLYKHFDSKETLAHEVIKTFQGEMSELVECKKREIPDPIERFETCALEAMKKRSKMNNIFLLDIKRDIPELWKEIEEFREKVIISHMDDILQEGIEKGKIRRDINTKVATNIYLGTIQTIMQPDVLAKNEFTANEAFENISKIFLEGVKAK